MGLWIMGYRCDGSEKMTRCQLWLGCTVKVRMLWWCLQVQTIDMLFLQDLRQRYPSTCGHLVTTSLMLRVTSSPETRGAASAQPMIILVPVPPSPVKRQPTPQPKPQTSRRAAPASAGTGRRTASTASARNNRPQTAHAILTRPPIKGLSIARIPWDRHRL